MKLLFLIPNLSNGGIQTQVFLLADYLAQKGYKVTVVGLFNAQDSFSTQRNSDKINVEFHSEMGNQMRNYIKSPFSKKLRFWINFIKWLRSFKPDVILSYTNPIDLYTNVVWRLTGAKLSFSFERGGYIAPEREQFNWMSRIRKWSRPIYVANSVHGAKALSIIRGISLRQVKIIRNSLDEKSLMDRLPQEDSLGSIKKSTTVFLMVANFFDKKDHLFLLEAWRKASMKNAKLIIFGLGGTVVCQSNFTKAQQFIRSNELWNVELMGEGAPSLALYHRADVGLLSSISEGCPNVIMEYMYFGLPVVSRDIPGVRELVSPMNYALLSIHDSVDDFAKKLNWCCANYNMGAKIGEANQQKALEDFANERMQSEYLEIFKNHGII